jgi:hypothetical protein
MKKFMILFLTVAVVIGFGGTCLSATFTSGRLTNESGVSFGQTPVISGASSGETLYVVSGGYAQADMVAVTGVSVWEIRPQLVGGAINQNVAFASLVGAGGYDAASGATVSPSSPVLIDNGATGNSVFFVTNVATGGGVTGFVLFGLSAAANGAETLGIKVDSATTNMGVWGPLAWTDKGWKGGSTSGTSLFFGTVDVESGGTPAAVSLAGYVAGSTVYVVNTNAVYTSTDSDAANNVNFRYEAGVSGFFSGPVISENSDGVSVYMVGLNGTTGTGNTLFCYDGAAIDGNIDPGAGGGVGWVIGPHESAGVGGATVFATPGLGKGTFEKGDNDYSGNSLFVVDGQGGVSVYNKTNGNLDLATQYGVVTTLPASYAGPVTNGKYLVLCSDNGVTVYGSAAANDLDNGNSSSWLWRTGNMTAANGWTANYEIFATPVISAGHLVVAVSERNNAGVDRQASGAVFVFRLSDGTLVDTTGAAAPFVASPIVSEGNVWIPGYFSDIFRYNLGDYVDGFAYSRQFKFDAGKTGENTEEDEVVFYEDDDDTCFISILK